MASDTMKITILLFIGLLLLIYPASADQIYNPYFETNSSGWDMSGTGDYSVLSTGWSSSFSSEYGVAVFKIGVDDPSESAHGYWSQDIDISGWSNLTFRSYSLYDIDSGNCDADMFITIGTVSYELPEGSFNTHIIDLDGQSGTQTIEFHASVSNTASSPYSPLSQTWIDEIYLTDEIPTSTLSGYITRSGTPLELATITLNNSGGDTISNESGYYSISDIEPGSYLVTTARTGYNSDESIVDLTSNQIHNVSLTYETPTLETLTILDSGDNSLLLGWKESLGADGVYVYVDSQSNLVATVETPYTNVKMHDLTNLEPGTSYNIWCKPYKDTIQGSMYYVSGTTTGGGGGSGGGGAVKVRPPYEDIKQEIPGYPDTYDMTNITSSDLITLASTNPEIIYAAISNISIKSPIVDKPGDNLQYFYLLIIGICCTLFSSKKEGWEVVTIISFVAVVISLIKLGWI